MAGKKRIKDNLVCPVCGKSFYRKPCYIKKRIWLDEICCSQECSKHIRRKKMLGQGNHQYGLKGNKNASFIQGDRSRKNCRLTECMVYVGSWYVRPSWCGRVPMHRYLVELNHTKFDASLFEEIGSWHYLKPGYAVHHKDFNHNNNNLDNLAVVTKSEHTTIHNIERKRRKLCI